LKLSLWAIVVVLYLAPLCVRAESVCPRPEPGSKVEEPEDLRSQNGVLEAHLTAATEENPYVPTNSPGLDDLTTMFNFPSN
jgi:hypothetical protein